MQNSKQNSPATSIIDERDEDINPPTGKSKQLKNQL